MMQWAPPGPPLPPRTPKKRRSKAETARENAVKARAALAAKVAARSQEEKEAAAQAKKERQAQAARKYQRFTRSLSREIGPFPQRIDWQRRLACKTDLKLFAETYLASVFYHQWSTDQLICIEKAQRISSEGGKFAVAMPRGGGKTAIVRAATIWATLYGHKHFIYNVGSTEPKSTQTLNFIQVQLENNPLLKQDFPEICWAIHHLAGTNRMARGQTFNNEPTHVHLGTDFIRYPILILPKDVAAYYTANDSSSVRWLERSPDYEAADVHEFLKDNPEVPRHRPSGDTTGAILPPKEEATTGIWLSTNAGVILRCSGIDGSIRGEAEVNPVTLEQPRPDLVILDDVQKDAKADSPIMCDKLIRLIDGAVTGLAGGGAHIDVLMPCTVIREGDAADTYLDPLKKPDFQGERCRMVNSWPPGVTDFEITNDTPSGQLWNQYSELRRTSLRDHGNFKLATELYEKNREVMDRDFVVSWSQRYDRRSEISAQQHAMNLRLQLGSMFLPEYQNIGRRLIETVDTMITAEQLMTKTIDVKRGHLYHSYQQVVAHIDVQDEVLFYLVFAFDYDFNGTFIDYGTWPEITLPYFTKSQTASWSNITRLFFAEPKHSALKSKAFKTSGGKVRAPLEAKIYWALGQLVTYLFAKRYIRDDLARKEFPISYLSIDTRWGQASEAVKRYIRESGFQQIIPYAGQDFAPTKLQLEEYERRDGWLFENQKNPNVKEPKWVIRPNPSNMWYMAADVGRLKDFLFSRLATPAGGTGCVNLYSAPSHQHELLSHHICSSEYPEPVSARGITKNKWTVREGAAFDNDYLDCAAACMALASFAGASIKTIDVEFRPIRRQLSDLAEAKRSSRSGSRAKPLVVSR